MVTIKDAIDISQISDATLKNYIIELQDEIDRRKKLKRGELINNFKQALRNLEQAGITVIVNGQGIKWGDGISCCCSSDNIFFD